MQKKFLKSQNLPHPYPVFKISGYFNFKNKNWLSWAHICDQLSRPKFHVTKVWTPIAHVTHFLFCGTFFTVICISNSGKYQNVKFTCPELNENNIHYTEL
jgi:hypothetical protein